jgi:2',3'-cyclic-nucleotide 2'-phosphodiesterase (5'-nucleotidase family)
MQYRKKLVISGSYIKDYFFILICFLSLVGLIFPAFIPVYSFAGVTVLFTNDTHGHVRSFDYSEMSKVGGAAHRASLINEIKYMNKKLNIHTILIDIGDVFRKDVFFDVFQGDSDARVMAAMGYSLMCLGNHEFSVAPDKLFKFSKKAGVELVATNVFNKDDHTYFVNPFIKKKYSNWDFYFLGVVTPETKNMVISKNIDNIIFEDPVESIKRTVNKINAENAVIIVMVHDEIDDAAMKIARVEGVKLVIAGHEHVKTIVPGTFKRAPIIEAYKYGLNIGRVDFEFQDDKCILRDMRIIPVGDPEIAKIVSKFEKIFSESEMRQVLAVLSKSADSQFSSRKQTSLGDLITDCIRIKMKSDIAVLNSGAIKDSRWKSGNITKEMVYELLPYNNYLEVLKIPGSSIMKMFRHSIDKRGENSFLQVSGMSITANRDGLIQIMVDNEPLVESQLYTVCTTDFIFSGGDGYIFSEYNPSDVLDRRYIRDAVIEQLQEFKTVSPVKEKRIVIEDFSGAAAN